MQCGRFSSLEHENVRITSYNVCYTKLLRTDLNIDFREISKRYREIGAQPDDHIVVYCQSGHRSNIAAETLADLGYNHVYSYNFV